MQHRCTYVGINSWTLKIIQRTHIIIWQPNILIFIFIFIAQSTPNDRPIHRSNHGLQIHRQQTQQSTRQIRLSPHRLTKRRRRFFLRKSTAQSITKRWEIDMCLFLSILLLFNNWTNHPPTAAPTIPRIVRQLPRRLPTRWGRFEGPWNVRSRPFF